MTDTNELAQLTIQRVRRWWVVPFFIGAVAMLVGASLRGWPPAITGRDINQHRANAPAAIPNDDLTITQTFVPARDGLHEIELIVYQVGEVNSGEIVLDLLDSAGNLVGSQVLGSAELSLNQTIDFQFAVQRDSADSPYMLRITGRNNLNTTFWGYDLEAISSGELNVSDPAAITSAKDLRLVTRYQLTPQLMLRRLSTLLQENLMPVVMLVWVTGVVGWLTLRGLGTRLLSGDLPTDLALTFAVGLCVWPLLWLWLTTFGGRWGRLSLWGLLTIATVVSLWLALRGYLINRKQKLAQNATGVITTPARTKRQIAWQHIVLGLLVVVGYFLRLLAIRDLAFPAWVDASRHGLMTAVMRDSGQFLQNYGDYLPVDHAPLYHFGYHSIAATLALLTKIELPTLLLTTGQLLNAVVPLAIYAAAYLLMRQRTVGLCAAFFITFPSFFPAYYVSWGRYTQLTGMIVMPVLIGWCYWMTSSEAENGEPVLEKSQLSKVWEQRNQVLLAGILGSGLFLIHFRVFLIFLPYGLLIWLFNLRRDNWWKLPLTGVATLGLVLPRFLQMARYVRPETIDDVSEGYNDFPVSYLNIGWERWFLIVAVLIVIVAALQFSRPIRWRNRLIVVALLVVVLIGEWLGSVPALFDITYARTAVVGLLLLLSLWKSAESWVAFPIAWLIFEPFFTSSNDKLILAGLLVATVWLVQLKVANAGRRVPLMLASAVGLLFVLLSGPRIGLPQTWVLNMNSTYITLFMPLAIILGYGFFLLGERATRSHWLVQTSVYAVLGTGMMLLTLYGGRQQIEIMNQGTVLAEPPDVAGIAWVDAHLPIDAKIAVSSWKWLGVTWAAQDGGAWLLPLTQRRVTIPPADYIYAAQLEREVRAFNVAASAVEDWSADSALALLREQQVTHIYIGARGGFLLPDKLLQHDDIQLRFAQDGVFILELLPE